MNLRPATAVLLALVLTVSAVSAEAQSLDPALIESGHAIARSNCARCHGIGPTDESPLEQAPPFQRIVKRYPIDHLAEAFAEGIVVGHNEMPPFELQPSQIDALLAYLGSLQKPQRQD